MFVYCMYKLQSWQKKIGLYVGNWAIDVFVLLFWFFRNYSRWFYISMTYFREIWWKRRVLWTNTNEGQVWYETSSTTDKYKSLQRVVVVWRELIPRCYILLYCTGGVLWISAAFPFITAKYSIKDHQLIKSSVTSIHLYGVANIVVYKLIIMESIMRVYFTTCFQLIC